MATFIADNFRNPKIGPERLFLCRRHNRISASLITHLILNKPLLHGLKLG